MNYKVIYTLKINNYIAPFCGAVSVDDIIQYSGADK